VRVLWLFALLRQGHAPDPGSGGNDERGDDREQQSLSPAF